MVNNFLNIFSVKFTKSSWVDHYHIPIFQWRWLDTSEAAQRGWGIRDTQQVRSGGTVKKGWGFFLGNFWQFTMKIWDPNRDPNRDLRWDPLGSIGIYWDLLGSQMGSIRWDPLELDIFWIGQRRPRKMGSPDGWHTDTSTIVAFDWHPFKLEEKIAKSPFAQKFIGRKDWTSPLSPFKVLWFFNVATILNMELPGRRHQFLRWWIYPPANPIPAPNPGDVTDVVCWLHLDEMMKDKGDRKPSQYRPQIVQITSSKSIYQLIPWKNVDLQRT